LLLYSAFDKHLANYKNAGYSVVSVYNDGETGLKAIKDYIYTLAEYNPFGPVHHVPTIERDQTGQGAS